MRRACQLAALAAALMAAGCGTAASVSSTARPAMPAAGSAASSTSPTPSATIRVDHPPRASLQGPAKVAGVFAHAYARYLDGRLTTAALPDANAAARAQVGPVITPGDRAGEVVVQSLRRTPGTLVFTAWLRDWAHTFPAQLTLGDTGGRWLVIAVTAPDLDSILHAHSNQIEPPSGSAPAEQAARTFMTGYLPWLYGKAVVGAIHDGAQALTAHLEAEPPRIPPTFEGLHPRLAAIGIQPHGVGWRAYALVTDGRETYDLVMAVKQLNGRWLVSSVGLPR